MINDILKMNDVSTEYIYKMIVTEKVEYNQGIRQEPQLPIPLYVHVTQNKRWT